MAMKRLLLSSSSIPLMSKSLHSFVRPITSLARPTSTRLFNTNSVRDYDDDDPTLHVDNTSARSVASHPDFSPFSDVFDPFSSTRSLTQILNAMDQFSNSPFLSSSSRLPGSTLRRGWDAKETHDGLHLRVDMPGLGKEDVKISVEHNTLIIKGQSDEEEEEDTGRRKYTSRIELPEKLYKVDGIKAEMKNGVLKVVVPKLKEEERTDVFHVTVQ